MSSNTSSGSNTSSMAVPEAKEAMKRFKEEVASEIGVPLKEGYNGELTSRQAGSIGGEMVKKSRCPEDRGVMRSPKCGNPYFGLLCLKENNFVLCL